MMDLRQIYERLWVTGQLRPEDLAGLAARGFKAIICNRPDGEEAGQPSFAEVQAAARAAGIEARHIPVVPAGAGPEEVAAFAKAMADLPGPVLAYCRSGARSAGLAAAIGHGNMPGTATG